MTDGWTAKEARTVLIEVVRRHPQCSDPEKIDVSITKSMIVEAADAVLASERKSVARLAKPAQLRVTLIAAAKKLSAYPGAIESLLKEDDAPKKVEPRIMWTDAEADLVAAQLVELAPGLLDSFDFATFTLPQFRQAQQVLPEDRRRHIKYHRNALPALTPAFVRLVQQRNAATPAPAPEPQAAEPIVAAPAPSETEPHQAKVITTPAEWVLIAEEIHRQNPFFGWPYKEHLAGLSAKEIEDAMRAALPIERRRKTVNVWACRDKLIEAFKVVRARLDKEEADKRAAAELEKAKAEAEALAKMAEADAIKNATPATDPLADALRLVAREFGAELAKAFGGALVPMLQGMLADALASAAPRAAAPQDVAPQTPAAPPEEDPLDAQPPASYAGPEGVPERNPKVAVIGPSSALRPALEAAFPSLDFIWIEHGPKGVPEAVLSCEKIIGVANFLNESTKIALKKSEMGKAKLRVVDGGTSSIKRLLHVLIQSGELRLPTVVRH